MPNEKVSDGGGPARSKLQMAGSLPFAAHRWAEQCHRVVFTLPWHMSESHQTSSMIGSPQCRGRYVSHDSATVSRTASRRQSVPTVRAKRIACRTIRRTTTRRLLVGWWRSRMSASPASFLSFPFHFSVSIQRHQPLAEAPSTFPVPGTPDSQRKASMPQFDGEPPRSFAGPSV